MDQKDPHLHPKHQRISPRRGVDKEAGTITVQAGARVSQILSELQKHGLTLENFSSITEARHKALLR